MWDFVIVVCYGHERGIAWREELTILSAQDLVPSKNILVVENTNNFGRGSGFLNALLLTVERICRAKNISNVCFRCPFMILKGDLLSFVLQLF